MKSVLKSIPALIGVILLIILVAAEINEFNMEKNPQKKDSDKPLFSAAAGFYEEPFWLEIEGNGRIFYTLDGSVPDEKDLEYTGAIKIDDPSGEENVYSANPDVSTGYYTELLEKYGRTVAEYELPKEPVDKCRIVRAVSIDENGNKSEIATAAYFIGFDEKTGYDDVDILSLSVEPEDFFSDEKGIYVTGNVFKKRLARVEEGTELSAGWQFWDANYAERGDKWERPVYIEYFDSKGNELISQSCTARIHGNVSRGLPGKSLNFYAKKEYGSERFPGVFFEGDKGSDKLTLFSGSMEKTHLRNYLGQTIMSNRGFDTLCVRPTVLFINGEYWGMYELGEGYSGEYIENKYGIDKSDTILIKNGEVEVGRKNDNYYYIQLLTYIADHDMRDSFEYEKASGLLDMEAYINYYAAMIYLGRSGDWPGTNYALFRSRRSGGEGYNDGKWRFMLFDLDKSCYESYLTTQDTLHVTRCGGGVMEDMFDSLCKNGEFQKQFANTICDLMNTSLSYENAEAVIDEYYEKHRDTILKSNARFFGENKTEADVLSSIEDMKMFFKNRKEPLLRQVAESFNIEAATGEIAVEIDDKIVDKVTLNTMNREYYADGKYSGTYFTKYPFVIKLERLDDGSMPKVMADDTNIEVPEDGHVMIYAPDNGSVKVRIGE